MKKDYIKGNTTEEKFASINKIFQYVFPRLHKRIISAIPPIPVFIDKENITDESLTIKKIIPISGTVNKVALLLIGTTKAIKLKVSVENDSGDKSFIFNVGMGVSTLDTNFDINSGDILTVSIDDSSLITDFYASFALNSPLKHIRKESILLEVPEDASEEA